MSSTLRPSRRTSLGPAAATITVLIATLTTSPLAAAAPGQPLAAASKSLSVEQSLAQAQRTGKKVEVTGAATPTDTVMANPNGTLTLTRSVVPTRKLVNRSWVPLDATLRRNADETVSPRVTSSTLRLSGGGSGPMATMANGGKSLIFSLPMSLPAPTLSGNTATYANVLPGVDLQLIATTQGGFSHVFVVRNAAAAANPALKKLTITTQAKGVTLTVDKTGNIAGTDRSDRTVLTAPAPMAWDSTAATADTAKPGPRHVPSTARGPGSAAKVAGITTTITAGKIELVPSQTLLTGPDTVYPVYIDPTFTWSAVGAKNNGWATISHDHPSTNFWKDTPDPYNRMQVGNSGEQWSHTLINFPIDTATLAGAVINSATLSITNTYSYSCSARRVNVYAPGTTLTSSNATWNYWADVNLGSVVDYKDFAYGYSDNCKARAVAFDVLPAVINDVRNSKKTQTFLLTGANESSDVYSWKEFLETSPTITITYNHKPNTPTGLTTSPTTSCTASTPTVIGDGPVSLYAPVSDRNGGALGVTFKLWKTADSTQTPVASSDPDLLTYNSGSTAVLSIPATTLGNAAGTTRTAFSWKVQVTDGNLTSDWSTTCNFTFDPTRPGAPTVKAPTVQTTIGQPATFTVSPPSDDTTPTSYSYQLNGYPPAVVTASSGNATITITPTRFTNTLTVTSLSGGGNFGETASITFNANPAATAADADFTGDNVADLVTPGNVNLPSGLWLNKGAAAGINTNAVNIGANGNGIGNNSPADFDGSQVLSGHFFGSGLQDVLVYYPGGNNPGHGSVLRGNGDGSVIQAQLNDNQISILSNALDDDAGQKPLQLANAGDLAGRGLNFPDLLGITANPAKGDYALNFYPSNDGIGSHFWYTRLDAVTPAGDMSWNNWTIASTQLSTGAAMFLWNRSTGDLYLWTGLRWTEEAGLIYTPYRLQAEVSIEWNKDQALDLVAADINADGTADLWTVGAGGKVTSWLVTNLAKGAGTISRQAERIVETSDHAWRLNDGIGNTPVTTAADSAGDKDMTASGNAVWHDGDLFSPSLLLNTDATGTAVDLTSPGSLASSGTLVDTTRSFTVSVWVKPTAAGGVIVSEDGAHSSRFILWDDKTDNTWRFGMATGDTTGWSYDQAIAPINARLGVWTHLVATFNADTRTMALYVNGLLADTAYHNPTVSPGWPSTGNLIVGRYLNNSAPAAYYSGQVSNLQTWETALTPTQLGAPNTAHARAGHWNFDRSGIDSMDASGNDHNLTFSGDTLTDGEGKYDTGLWLGGDGYASTTNVVNTVNGYTICAWANINSTNLAYKAIFSQDGSRSSGFWLRTNANGYWEFVIATSDSAYTTLTSPVQAQSGTWTHVCGAWDPATTQMMIFIDGKRAGVRTATAGIAATGRANIGRYKYLDTYGGYFAGTIDDVRVYVGPITELDEIQMIKDSRLGAPDTAHASAGQWNFDAITGTTSDASGNYRTLTLNGSATTGAGRYADGLALNGTSGYASATSVISTTNGYTACAWAKFNNGASTATKAVLSQEASRSSGFWLRTNANGYWEFVIANSDSAYTAVNSAAPAQTNTWTHVCGVWNPSAAQMKLFINGQLAGSRTVSSGVTATGPFNIGRYKYLDNYGGYFPGAIDDVRVYVGPINDSTDIQQIMNRTY